MVLLINVTPDIKTALEVYHSKHPKKDTQSTEKPIDSTSLDNLSTDSLFIARSQLVNLARLTETPLSVLTRNLSIYVPPAPKSPPKTKEYLQLMEKLRRQEEEKEYMAMIGSSTNGALNNFHSVGGDDDIELTPGQQVKQVKEQLTTILNIAISVASVAFAIWYWSANYSNWSLALRTLLSIFGALLTVVAETVVYLGYKRRVKEAAVKERKKKEKKSVVSNYGLTESSDQIGAEKIVTLDFSKSSSVEVSQANGTKKRN